MNINWLVLVNRSVQVPTTTIEYVNFSSFFFRWNLYRWASGEREKKSCGKTCRIHKIEIQSSSKSEKSHFLISISIVIGPWRRHNWVDNFMESHLSGRYLFWIVASENAECERSFCCFVVLFYDSFGSEIRFVKWIDRHINATSVKQIPFSIDLSFKRNFNEQTDRHQRMKNKKNKTLMRGWLRL